MTEEIKQAKIITGIVHILRLQLLNVIVDQSTVAYAVAYFLNKIMNLLKNKKGSLIFFIITANFIGFGSFDSDFFIVLL